MYTPTAVSSGQDSVYFWLQLIYESEIILLDEIR